MPDVRVTRSTDSAPDASVVRFAGPPNESRPSTAMLETASAFHKSPRHPYEFPPNEWMAVFGAICLLLLAAMIFGAVRKYLLDRKRQAAAERVARWASPASRKKAKGKKPRR